MQYLKKTIRFAVLAGLLATSLSACSLLGSPLQPGQGLEQSDFGNLQGQEAVPDEYLIKRKGNAYLQSPEEFAQQNNMLFVREIEPLGVELFKVSDPSTLDQIADMVEYAEPNYLRHLSLPNQSDVGQLSVLHTQDATAGDSINPGNNFIGLVDTGVDTSHPDLQGKLLAGHNTLGKDSVDDDNGHGTYLAGIAVGQDASQQLNGVLPNGKILPIKALDANGIGTDFSISEGIVMAVDYGAQVIVLSATGAKQGQALTAAMDYANQHNVPIVVPSGNQMDASSVFPGSSQAVLAVNSVDVRGQSLTRFSRPAQNLTISAVGEGIRSTLPTHPVTLNSLGVGSGYGQLQTPGAAAMQAAAAIAAIKALNPGIRLPEIRNQLMASAVDLGQPGPDPQFGSGRLSMARVSSAHNAVAAQAYPQQQQPAYGYQTAPVNRAAVPNAYPQAYPQAYGQNYGQPVQSAAYTGYAAPQRAY